MKISVLILTSDERYYNKVSSALYEKYSGKFSFVSALLEDAEETIAKFNPDVVLIDDMYPEFKINNKSKTMAVAYITEKHCGDERNDCRCFCKYVGITILNKHILGLVTFPVADYEDYSSGNFYMFSSAAGGSGATTCAIAFAMQMASTGKEVLFMSFDRLFDTKLFFPDVKNSLSDFLYAFLHNQNTITKAETLINRDENTRLNYVNGPQKPIELSEFNDEAADAVLNSFSAASKADIIVLDVPYSEKTFWYSAVAKATNIVVVTQTSNVAISKLGRFAETVRLEEKAKDKEKLDGCSHKISVIKNMDKSSNKATELFGFKVMCSIPKYSGGDFASVINKVSQNMTSF